MVGWHLKPFLDRHGISAYAVVQRTAGELAPATVYGLARERPARVDLETLDKLIRALRELTGEDVSVGDLLEYEVERGS